MYFRCQALIRGTADQYILLLSFHLPALPCQYHHLADMPLLLLGRLPNNLWMYLLMLDLNIYSY